MESQIDPLVAEELRDNILNVDYTTFLEHALSCPPSLAAEWNTFFSELRHLPKIKSYLKELLAAKESDLYTPFANMANVILVETQRRFPLPDSALPDVRFVRNDPTIIKGPPDANTPSRKPDMVLVRKHTADNLEARKKSVSWVEILCAIEFKLKPKRSDHTSHQNIIIDPLVASPSLKCKASGELSSGTPSAQMLRIGTRSGSIYTAESGISDDHFKQLSSYPLEIFSSTKGTREIYAINIMVDGDDLQLWCYDRAGAIYCNDWINYRDDFVRFATVISACGRLSLHGFGILSFVNFSSQHDVPESLQGATLSLRDVDGQDHTVVFNGDIISFRPGIVLPICWPWFRFSCQVQFSGYIKDE